MIKVRRSKQFQPQRYFNRYFTARRKKKISNFLINAPMKAGNLAIGADIIASGMPFLPPAMIGAAAALKSRSYRTAAILLPISLVLATREAYLQAKKKSASVKAKLLTV